MGFHSTRISERNLGPLLTVLYQTLAFIALAMTPFRESFWTFQYHGYLC